jgi:HTH-type transcriptional regulator, competence development regulator
MAIGSPFGELCRQHRAKRGLFLADQSEATNLSVSLISAIELGKRTVPEGYPEIVARWLHLNDEERKVLLLSVAESSNIIKFRPKDAATAKFAFQLSKRLNSMSKAELDSIRETLERGEKIYE